MLKPGRVEWSKSYFVSMSGSGSVVFLGRISTSRCSSPITTRLVPIESPCPQLLNGTTPQSLEETLADLDSRQAPSVRLRNYSITLTVAGKFSEWVPSCVLART